MPRKSKKSAKKTASKTCGGTNKTETTKKVKEKESKKLKNLIIRKEPIGDYIANGDFMDGEQGKYPLCPILLYKGDLVVGMCMRRLKRNICPVHKSIK
jgi:hypothetical protein